MTKLFWFCFKDSIRGIPDVFNSTSRADLYARQGVSQYSESFLYLIRKELVLYPQSIDLLRVPTWVWISNFGAPLSRISIFEYYLRVYTIFIRRKRHKNRNGRKLRVRKCNRGEWKGHSTELFTYLSTFSSRFVACSEPGLFSTNKEENKVCRFSRRNMTWSTQ